VDAVADADLSVIAEACRDMPLMTGGSAVAMPLPMLYEAAGLLNVDAAKADRPTVAAQAVILSGSCSAMTRAQVATYLADGAPGYKLDPLALAREGAGPALEWLMTQDLSTAPLIYATAEPDAVQAAQNQLGAAQAGEIVEVALAKLAIAARDQGARRIVVAGGETSGAVTKALSVTRLSIGAEIAPGVPWTYAETHGHTIALTLKSGNFGAETFFTDALKRLEAP
jgi:uncharacterized protein YgbK (DUF1537 family)